MRDFLKGLELDKETIDTIMAEFGKNVQGLREQKEELENKVKTLQSENDTFKSSQKESDDWKTKYETLTTDYENSKNEVNDLKEQLSQKDYEHRAEKVFETIKFSSESAKSSILSKFKEKKLTYNEETKAFDGFDDFIKEVKTNDPGAFYNPNKPVFATTTGGKAEDGSKGRLSYQDLCEMYPNS